MSASHPFAAFRREPADFRDHVTEHDLVPGELGEGLTNHEDWFVWRSGQDVRIYDRICDHNGGRLIFNNNRISCPMHGWNLDPASGRYLNVDCAKTPVLATRVEDPQAPLQFELRKPSRQLTGFTRSIPVEVEFLNHACLLFRAPGICFATDPWLLGPAFCNGWWLSLPSPVDALERINACDFLFISHNHPDHLHRETLEQVRRDMPILTPAFSSGSTERYLRDLGFADIRTEGFDTRLVDDVNEVAISILKSGDFRDDSGLLLEIGGFSALLAVDANFIDFHRFPEAVTLYASSFASGASGFPLCFDNYSDEEKQGIVTRNRNVARYSNTQILSRLRPQAFLPYAGFFSEAAPRDDYIRTNNRKNSVASYAGPCSDNGVELLDVTSRNRFLFAGNKLIEQGQLGVAVMPPANVDAYLLAAAAAYSALGPDEVETYFMESDFRRALNLCIRLTDDDFEAGDEAYYCRFGPEGPEQVKALDRQGYETLLENLDTYLSIRIRRAEFIRVIRLGLPWEDLSIGFQCRVKRQPNVYHSDFWYHFSNIYVNDRVRRESLNCDACLRLQHEFVV